MEDVDAHVCPSSCPCCEATHFSMFLLPRGPRLGLCRQQLSSSCVPVRLKAQGGSAHGESLPQRCRYSSSEPPSGLALPGRGPEPRPREQLETPRAGSELLSCAQEPIRPLGHSGREAQEIHRLTRPHISGHRAGAIWEECSGHGQGWACGQGGLQWREPEGSGQDD
uniref:Uncharacterized protein n=1 Tax=Equus asinus asinus TaxID=83772 RepID=A0A8C4PPN0_EQUAS